MGGEGRFRNAQTAGLLAAALAFASLHQPAAAAASAPTATDEAAFLASANALRASAGLRPLVLDAGLSSFARGWSAAMGEAGDISHNPNLAAALAFLPPRSTLRENVGMGPGVAVVQQALAASARHRANILNPRATRVGIGVVRVGAVVFVTQNFLEGPATRPATAGAAGTAPAASAAAPPPRATPRPEPAAATARLHLVLDQLRALGV